MTLKKIQCSTFILFAVSTLILLFIVIDLGKEKKESRATIEHLAQELMSREKQLEGLEKDKQELDMLRFKEEILRAKNPGLAKIARIVFEKSRSYGFSPSLIMAIIEVESGFNPSAISSAGAYGLMQINYAVWKDELDIDFDRIFDKEYNIELGLKVLKYYYDQTNGNILKALFHYNNGYKYENTKYSGQVTSSTFYKDQEKTAPVPAALGNYTM